MRSAILAGGTAARFAGRPKGLEWVGGQRILDRAVAAVTEATGLPPLLIANDPGADAWRPDLRLAQDALPGSGTLGGLYTAVAAGPGPVLVLAWDMPFVPVPLLRALVDGSPDSDVYLPESGGPRRLEPLCGVYGPGCGSSMRACIARRDFRAVAFHDYVRVGMLPRAEVARFGPPARVFFNVNTPEDRGRAEAMWRGPG